MAFPSDLRHQLSSLLSRITPWLRLSSRSSRSRRWRASGRSAPQLNTLADRWPRGAGSALVQALMAGLIAVIGGFLLASRLLSSRFNSFSRSDTLAAREAAEYGLNELQAQLNTDQHAYLWVTRRNNWSTVTRTALTDCDVSVLDPSGNEVTTLPALPAGVSSAKTIKTDSEATITYQLSDFVPPSLPDNEASTQNQEEFCGENNATAAANFGNLKGGSALITVTGTVTRGSNQTNFRLSRRTHVVAPATAGAGLAYSFIILGDAYKTSTTEFGDSKDITRLVSADGNICYGTRSDPSCFSPPNAITLPKTIIGCFDLGSCLINNVDLDDRTRTKYCADVKVKKKKKRGFTCNEFQQIGDLPPVPTPASTGMIINGSPYTDANWSAYSAEYDCDAKDYDSKDYSDLTKKTTEWECEVKSTQISKKDNKEKIPRTRFPYRDYATLPANQSDALSLRNSDLVPGCYFSGVNAASPTSQASPTTTQYINCLVRKLKIDNEEKVDNFIVHTANGPNRLIAVNMFLHGSNSDEIVLEKGGIEGNDTGDLGWSRLQLLGKPIPTAANSAVTCRASSPIISKGKNGNDLENLFLWLPNASLKYDKKGSRENSYAVMWLCKFEGPKKDGSTKFSIITPIPEDVARAGLGSSLGSGFTKLSGSTYRGRGSEDIPAPQ